MPKEGNYDGYGTYGNYWTAITKKAGIATAVFTTAMVVLHAYLVTHWR